MHVDNAMENLGIMFQYRVLCMLSVKEQDNYADRLIDEHNLIPIGKQIEKRAHNLLNNSINFNNFLDELERPLSDLNMNDLENVALLLYLALLNPKRFRISKEKVKEIPGKVLQLIDYARERLNLQASSGRKDISYKKRKSVKFFAGLLICLRNYLQNI